jgi:hypothetical protein
MKKIFFIAILAAGFFTSCDHVENPYPPAVSQGSWDLYPSGDSLHYYQNVFQTFTANANTDRNVLIEDFTGHKCLFCPDAAVEAEIVKAANSGRVFIEAIHTSPVGLGSFQQLYPSEGYSHDFTCPEGLAIGQYFGADWPGSPFFGNPFGAVSRADGGNGYPVQYYDTWGASTTALLSANDLKVNLQAQVNYYTGTRGLFVHIEADVLDAGLTNELNLVAHLVENSRIANQLMPDNSTNTTYDHHDVLVGSLDASTWGQTLDTDHLDANGKYYFDYIYELPTDYDPTNMSLVFYVRDAVTEEIYQVIEEHVL